jgi:hypothetical protein
MSDATTATDVSTTVVLSIFLKRSGKAGATVRSTDDLSCVFSARNGREIVGINISEADQASLESGAGEEVSSSQRTRLSSYQRP